MTYKQQNKDISASPVQTLLKLRKLLETEYEEEKEEYRRHSNAEALPRKVKRGDAWFPVRMGRNYYNSLNQPVIEVHRTADDDVEHNFEFGRPVCFFPCPTR